MKTSCFSYASLQTMTTATRLHNPAQGCRAATTLGTLWQSCTRNPVGVAPFLLAPTIQRCRYAPTLGCKLQPLGGCRRSDFQIWN